MSRRRKQPAAPAPVGESFACRCEDHNPDVPRALPVRERETSPRCPANWCEACWAAWFWGRLPEGRAACLYDPRELWSARNRCYCGAGRHRPMMQSDLAVWLVAAARCSPGELSWYSTRGAYHVIRKYTPQREPGAAMREYHGGEEYHEKHAD